MEEDNSSSDFSPTENSQDSTSAMITNLPSLLLPNPSSSASYFRCPSGRISYFNSAFESAMKQHLHDDDPIPYIDENLSVTHSRKSSACWSDRTSLSSRFGLAWKLNFMRSSSQSRPSTIGQHEASTGPSRRFNYRTIRYALPPSKEHVRMHEQV